MPAAEGRWRGISGGIALTCLFAGTGIGRDVMRILLQRHGLGNEIALPEIAADVAQILQLMLCFDAFAQHGQLQTLAHADHGFDDDARGVGIPGGVVEEGLVHLDDIHVKGLEYRQRGIALAEVVQSKKDTVAAQSGEAFLKLGFILQRHAFGDFHFDKLRRNVELLEDAGKEVNVVAGKEQRLGLVDADAGNGFPGVDAASQPAAHGAQDKEVQFLDEAVLFKERNKFVRENGLPVHDGSHDDIGNRGNPNR